VALAEEIGISAAAQQLGRPQSQLYGWRNKLRTKQSQSAVDQQLATENARLKRQLAEQAEELAILKKAAAYFAKSVK
jgi:transposase